jgi:hypothetical protein
MNERIRELAEQIVCFEQDMDGSMEPNEDGQWIRVDELEKFAELIVREYEKLLPEMCSWADADKEGPMKGWHVQFVARKHFGVEE